MLAGVALVAVVVTGIRAREQSGEKLKEWTDEQAVPTVAVTRPDAKVLNPTIDLPGRLEAYSRAPIFARVPGYLKSWSADIGARVKASYEYRDGLKVAFSISAEPPSADGPSRAISR